MSERKRSRGGCWDDQPGRERTFLGDPYVPKSSGANALLGDRYWFIGVRIARDPIHALGRAKTDAE